MQGNNILVGALSVPAIEESSNNIGDLLVSAGPIVEGSYIEKVSGARMVISFSYLSPELPLGMCVLHTEWFYRFPNSKGTYDTWSSCSRTENIPIENLNYQQSLYLSET